MMQPHNNMYKHAAYHNQAIPERDYSYHGGGFQRTPFLDDLFFGAPVTQKLKKGISYIKGKAKGFSNYFKGVSAGGEEFTYKLERQLNPKKKKGEQSEPVAHP